ncbi:MAG TPA: hypothetical protein VGD08_06995 [Stellaceae bacterium]|jgi:hypothetical protein
MPRNGSAAAAAAVTTNIPARLDRLPWSRFHLLVVVALGITLETRALAIAFFYALGTAIGGIVAPWLFGHRVALVRFHRLCGRRAADARRRRDGVEVRHRRREPVAGEDRRSAVERGRVSGRERRMPRPRRGAEIA